MASRLACIVKLSLLLLARWVVCLIGCLFEGCWLCGVVWWRGSYAAKPSRGGFAAAPARSPMMRSASTEKDKIGQRPWQREKKSAAWGTPAVQGVNLAAKTPLLLPVSDLLTLLASNEQR